MGRTICDQIQSINDICGEDIKFITTFNSTSSSAAFSVSDTEISPSGLELRYNSIGELILRNNSEVTSTPNLIMNSISYPVIKLNITDIVSFKKLTETTNNITSSDTNLLKNTTSKLDENYISDFEKRLYLVSGINSSNIDNSSNYINNNIFKNTTNDTNYLIDNILNKIILIY